MIMFLGAYLPKAKKPYKELIMPFELWSKDEYGQGSIIARFDDIESLVKRARKEVNSINVDNALAASEKKNSWEAYFVEVFEKGEPSLNRIYAGNNPDNKHRINIIQKNGSVTVDKLSDAETIRIYLGELDGNKWYASDVRGREIDSLGKREAKMALEGKTVFFARVI